MTDNLGDDPEFNDSLPKPKARRRFSLFELIAALGIVAVLIALLLPATRTARPAARRMQCVNNLRQIAQGLLNYEHVYKTLPPAHTVDANGTPLHSWRTLILPYIEHERLYQAIDLSKPWNDPTNARALETSVSVYCCPEAVGPRNTTTYLAIAAPGGCFVPDGFRRLAEITDTRKSTLMLIE